jgi:hypothetical protein
MANKWLDIVLELAPAGLHSAANIVVNGNSKATKFYTKNVDDGISYVIPLTRDLLDDEAGIIAVAWDRAFPEQDFTIDFSQAYKPNKKIEAEKQNVFSTIAIDAAKKMHATWLQEKINNNWRYGLRFSPVNHTHPMMRPWEQLSDKQRTIEIDRVKQLLQILDSNNLQIVYRND